MQFDLGSFVCLIYCNLLNYCYEMRKIRKKKLLPEAEFFIDFLLSHFRCLGGGVGGVTHIYL